MGNYKVTVLSIDNVTPDVIRIVTNKPAGFDFEPGMATRAAINKNGWSTEKRPFTMTSLPDHASLEFTIKTYPEKEGVTNELLELKTNDELVLHGVFGSIAYKGEGVFIAGGAGITPFISILRDLKAKNEIGFNMLLFANKTKSDIILEDELNDLLGNAFINILSEEHQNGYAFGRITESFLKEHIHHFDQHFYICGPPAMIADIELMLLNLGVEKTLITKEIF